MPKLQAIGASLRVVCRARKMRGRWCRCGFSTAETILLENRPDVQLFSGARNNPFICLLFIDLWYCPHVPIRKMLSVCPYTKFLSLRFACSELVVMLKRDFTTSGCLVLFSLKVTIIKRSHLIVSATVFLAASRSCARRNNLQYKDKNTRLTLITFYQDKKHACIRNVGIEILVLKA